LRGIAEGIRKYRINQNAARNSTKPLILIEIMNKNTLYVHLTQEKRGKKPPFFN